MKVIYEPKGKAKEYSDLATNLFTGCSHGCLYCYVPSVLHIKPEEFHSSVTPRKGVLMHLEREAPKHKGKEVMLCFTCDPYPKEEMKLMVTRRAIEILHKHGVGVNILTKGGLRAERDFDLLAANPELSRIGATLTFDELHDTLEWEPNAACPEYRYEMLKRAKLKGIRTWASLEPVIDPEQTLQIIKRTVGFVDHYKMGRWNYDKRANEIDWADFLKRAVELLEKHGASYYIKKDLAVFSDRAME